MTKTFSYIHRRDVIIGGLSGLATLALPLPFSQGAMAADAGQLRIGSLKFGSLGWLLKTVIDEGLDKEAGFELVPVDMANTGASKIALLSGEADVIVSDWPWAMRQRSEGEQIRFAPYSSALGAVMVAGDSPMKTIGDLEGKRLGVAGSALDKSWLLLQSYFKKETGKDLAQAVSPIFGAAPLITEQMRQGRIDAALNFWTFSARLKGDGYRELVALDDVLSGLGISPTPSLVGFIWNEKKTAGKEAEIAKFFTAIRKANDLLATSDEAWAKLEEVTRAQSKAEFEALKAYYRSGIPKPWGDEQTSAAEKLFNLLVELGEKTLDDGKVKFDPALFHGA